MALQDLTLDDQEWIEDYSGQPLSALSNPDALKAKTMKAIAYRLKLQTDPAFTIADAGKLTQAQMNDLIGEDPT